VPASIQPESLAHPPDLKAAPSRLRSLGFWKPQNSYRKNLQRSWPLRSHICCAEVSHGHEQPAAYVMHVPAIDKAPHPPSAPCSTLEMDVSTIARGSQNCERIVLVIQLLRALARQLSFSGYSFEILPRYRAHVLRLCAARPSTHVGHACQRL
jgi:hypothetical protein